MFPTYLNMRKVWKYSETLANEISKWVRSKYNEKYIRDFSREI